MQAKWIYFLTEYVFDTKHIKVKENNVADALGRRLDQVNEFF